MKFNIRSYLDCPAKACKTQYPQKVFAARHAPWGSENTHLVFKCKRCGFKSKPLSRMLRVHVAQSYFKKDYEEFLVRTQMARPRNAAQRINRSRAKSGRRGCSRNGR